MAGQARKTIQCNSLISHYLLGVSSIQLNLGLRVLGWPWGSGFGATTEWEIFLDKYFSATVDHISLHETWQIFSFPPSKSVAKLICTLTNLLTTHNVFKDFKHLWLFVSFKKNVYTTFYSCHASSKCNHMFLFIING